MVTRGERSLDAVLRTNSGSTINRRMCYLRILMRYAVDLKLIPAMFKTPRRNTKNSTLRVLTATPRVSEALGRLRAKYGHLKGPFKWHKRTTTRHIWDRLRGDFAAWMGDERVLYTFRHTCASRFAMAGKSAVQIMRWMGHKNLVTTNRYVHLSPATMEDMAAALAQYVEPQQRLKVVAAA